MASDVAPAKHISSRRAAREAALKALYAVEVGGCEPDSAIEEVLTAQSFEPQTANFARSLVSGILARLGELDERIVPLLAADWDYSRIAVTDKLILRMACYELFEMPEMPPKVSISEAVVLANRYGGEESGRFVNGLLGRLFDLSPKVNFDPSRFESQPAEPESEAEPDPEVVEADSAAHEDLRAGKWRLRKPEGSE